MMIRLNLILSNALECRHCTFMTWNSLDRGRQQTPPMSLKALAGSGLLIFFLAFAIPAFASFTDLLKDSPISYFTDEDQEIFDKTLNDTLNISHDGETRIWSNPNTKAGGEMTALRTFNRDGLTCRTLSVINNADDLSATRKFTYCRTESGAWKIAD